MPLTTDDEIADLLTHTRTVALVGASDRPARASYDVMRFLQLRGYRVLPVNPRAAGRTLLRRLTMVVTDGVVENVFYPVVPPDRHAAEVPA